MSNENKTIRKVGAPFVMSNALPNMIKQEFAFSGRTKKESSETDYAVYKSPKAKTVIDAANIPGATPGMEWPEKVFLTVDSGRVSIEI